MMNSEKKQIYTLFSAIAFFCLAVVIAIFVRLMRDDDTGERTSSLAVSEDTVAYGTVVDTARSGGRALHDTSITLEASGVSKVGQLGDGSEGAGSPELIDFISGTAADALESAMEESASLESGAVEFITATADDAGDGEVVNLVTETVDSPDDEAEEQEDEDAPSSGAEDAPVITEIDIDSLPSDNSVVLGSNISFTQDGVIDWNYAVMADVDDYMNVRTSPNTESAIAGKMEKGDVGTIIDIKDGWVHMVSGDLDGYMKLEYCVIEDEAKALAEEVCSIIATTTTAGLRIRKGPSTDDGIIRSVEKGYKLTVADDDDVDEDYDKDQWVAVKSGNGIGFVSREYVTISWNLGEGMTKEEEDAIRREKEEAARKGKASTNTDDLILLAALIQGEGNGQPYEGKVAIANVVLNRVNSGSYPNSIYNVIYQPGQFGPAGSGKVAQIVLHGPSKSNIEAAAAALGGQNYIGGLTHFKSVYSGMQGAVIGSHVFY